MSKVSKDRNTLPDRADEDGAVLAPFLAAAREARHAPLDDTLARLLTDQALAAMPAFDAPAPARTQACRRRWGLRSPRRGWREWLLAPPGLTGAAAVAGIAGLVIGLWVPSLDEVASAALSWAGLPLAEPGPPWAEDAGLLALIER